VILPHTIAASAVFTIGLMHIGVSWAKTRYALLGQGVDGKPVLACQRGRWHRNRMRRLRLNEQDIMVAARQQGIERLEQIR
jgi:uncharacterized membrane protein YcaP (DUF421 family)